MHAAKAALLEVVFVFAVGAAVGCVANALSPKGLRLDRDYFPEPARGPGTALPASGSSAADQVLERLKRRGLAAIDVVRGDELFRNPGYLDGRIVFVDARDDAHYRDGHIPGAWQLDHYHPENYLAEVVPACLVAQQVVVYCQGGACEDSEFAAVHLQGAGIAGEKLLVLIGGLGEWSARKLPIENGARGSGQLQGTAR